MTCAAAALQGGSTHIIGIGGTDPYGYAAGLIGTCAPGTFIDGAGNTRTIDGMLYNGGTSQIFFRINGAAVPNTNATFIGIIIGGVLYTRASASYGTPGVYTQWVWNVGSNVVGTSGSTVLQVMK